MALLTISIWYEITMTSSLAFLLSNIIRKIYIYTETLQLRPIRTTRDRRKVKMNLFVANVLECVAHYTDAHVY